MRRGQVCHASQLSLTGGEEYMVGEFRRRTLLPLDDSLGHLREALPQLTRRALHRCLIRHGISKRPNQQQNKNQREQFEPTKMGYLYIDSGELRLEEGKQHMFLAIDRREWDGRPSPKRHLSAKVANVSSH
ncbi:hypothetical protein CUC53_17500 [Aeromonas cavernicola]|uniref:Transposase n=1 Tax=Aeromonas cavernicola TaxID=1006623 RepID=A0A2H9U0R4_9GAMM|nr:hypothetical protein CUC53_17500 [Aeromonas cavernicola]